MPTQFNKFNIITPPYPDDKGELSKALGTLYNYVSTSLRDLPPKKSERKDWEQWRQQVYVEPQATRLFQNNEVTFKEQQPSPEVKSISASASSHSLFYQFSKFLADPEEQRVAVILGDPGAGKTTFAKHWLRDCLSAHAKDQTKPFPIFINLNDALGRKKLRPNLLLEDYLKEVVHIPNPNLIQQHVRLIVFCDGYDEVSYDSNLYLANDWKNWPLAQFVFSVRPEKFGLGLQRNELKIELNNHFAPELLASDSNIPSTMMVTQLRKFSKEQVQEFIQQWQPLANPDWEVERFWDNLTGIPKLLKLAANPVILSLVLYFLPSLEIKNLDKSAMERQHLKRIDIYDKFVSAWFDEQASRSKDKLAETDPRLVECLDKIGFNWLCALRHYNTNLAYWCLQNAENGKLKIDIPIEETLRLYLLNDPQEPGNLVDQLKKQNWSQPEVSCQHLLEALRSGCLLACNKQYFRFLHKTLIEYFAQESVFRGLIGKMRFMATTLINNNNNNNNNNDTSNFKKLRDDAFNTEIVEPSFLKFLADRAQQNEELKNTLYEVVEASKKDPRVAFAASNAITVLNYAKQTLNLVSWKGIRIPGADLSGANLHQADFRDADLSRVNFRQAILVNADMSGALVVDCAWGSKDNFRFDFSICEAASTYDGEWLLVGESAAGMIHFIHRQSFLVERTVKHYQMFYTKNDRVTCLAVDGGPDFQRSECLASGSLGGIIHLWDLPNATDHQTLAGHSGAVNSVAITADGAYLAPGGEDQTVRIWSLKPLKKSPLASLKDYTSRINSVCWSPKGNQVALGGSNGTVCVWKPLQLGLDQSPMILKGNGHNTQIFSVAWSPKGDRLAAGGNGKTMLWSLAQQDQLPMVLEEGHHVCWSPEGNRLAAVTGFFTIKQGASVLVWTLDGSEQAPAILGPFLARESFTFTAYYAKYCINWLSGDELALCLNREVRLLRLAQDKQPKQQLDKQPKDDGRFVNYAAWSPGCDRLVSSFHHQVFVWELDRQKQLPTLEFASYMSGYISCLSWSPKGDRLALGNDMGKIFIISFGPQGGSRTILEGHEDEVISISWSPSGNYLASGSLYGTVLVWALDADPLNKLHVISRDFYGARGYSSSVSWSPDGHSLVFVSRGDELRVWSLREPEKLPIHLKAKNIGWLEKGSGEQQTSVLWSSNGDQLVTGSVSGRIYVWKPNQSTRSLVVLHERGYQCGIVSMLWLPGGDRLVSVNLGGIACVWDIKRQECLQTLSIGTIISTYSQGEELRVAWILNSQLQAGFFKQNSSGAYCLSSLFFPLFKDDLASPMGKSFQDTLKVDNIRGLNLHQYLFLQGQGATGKPLELQSASPNQLPELIEEDKELKKLIQFKNSLANQRDSKNRAVSILDGNITIELLSWAVYFVRIVKPERPKSKCNSDGNRHVYGIAEGLNLTGCRVLIRFDLVEDSSDKNYARVKVKTETDPLGNAIDSGRVTLMRLFKSDQQQDPEKLVRLSVGCLDISELKRLLEKIVNEQARQPSKKNPNPKQSQRILYRSLGGDEAISYKHNCLTWLRHILITLGVPSHRLLLSRHVLDRIGVDPKNSLHAADSPSLFSTRPKELADIDVSQWAEKTHQNTLAK